MRRYGLFIGELVATYDHTADGYEEALTDARLMFDNDGTKHDLREYEEANIKKQVVADEEGNRNLCIGVLSDDAFLCKFI